MSKLKNFLKKFNQGYKSGVQGVGRNLNKLNRPTNPNFLKKVMPYEYSRSFQKQKLRARKQLKAKHLKGRASSSFSRLPPPLNLQNKFVQKLLERERFQNELHEKRLRSTAPNDYVKRLNALKDMQRARDLQFAQENNILRAKMEPSNMDFLNTEASQNILKSANVIKMREDSINLAKKRPFNILNTKEGGNNLKF